MAVIGGAGRGALAEKCVRLVEEQDPVPVLRQVEDFGKVLFRLADILRYNHRQVHPIDIHVVFLA